MQAVAEDVKNKTDAGKVETASDEVVNAMSERERRKSENEENIKALEEFEAKEPIKLGVDESK